MRTPVILFPHILLSFLLLTCQSPALLADSDHVIFYLKRGGMQCFTTTAPANDQLTGEVRVTNGIGDLTIGIWLLISPTHQVLLSKSNVVHEKFSLPTPPGPHHGHDHISIPAEYKLCIFNREALSPGDPNASRKIYVAFHAASDLDVVEGETETAKMMRGIARQKDMNDIQAVIVGIERSLNGVKEEIDHIRDREQALFDITTRVTRQVWLMGVLSCMAIIGAAGLFQFHQTQDELHTLSAALSTEGARRQRRRLRMRRTGSLVLPGSLKSLKRIGSFVKDSSQSHDSLPSHTGMSRAASTTRLESMTTGEERSVK